MALPDDLVHPDDQALFEIALRILDVCQSMAADDALLVIQLAWMLRAKQSRDEALAFPGGFQNEKTRQVEQLEKIALLVREDTPDVEMERLLHEGDVKSAINHIRKLLNEEGGA